MVQPLWKTVWQFLKRLSIELPYDPVIPLLGIYPREMKTYVWDFPGGPVVKTLPSNAGGAGSIPGQGAEIPHASGPRKNKT